MENKGIGLVLEGGGMRGMYTAAVLDVFLQRKGGNPSGLPPWLIELYCCTVSFLEALRINIIN